MKPPRTFGYQLPVGPGRLHRNLVASGIAILVGLIGQGSKWLVIHLLVLRPEPLSLVGNQVTLRLTQNPGAALSSGRNETLIVTTLSSVMLAALTVTMLLSSSRAWAYTSAVIIGGGFGNITDHHMGNAFDAGAVTDFIDCLGLFVGNVADILVIIGIVLMFRLMLKNVSIFGYAASEGSKEGVETQMAPYEPGPKAALRSIFRPTPHEPAEGKSK